MCLHAVPKGAALRESDLIVRVSSWFPLQLVMALGQLVRDLKILSIDFCRSLVGRRLGERGANMSTCEGNNI